VNQVEEIVAALRHLDFSVIELTRIDELLVAANGIA
jgi:hypothetical protein